MTREQFVSRLYELHTQARLNTPDNYDMILATFAALTAERDTLKKENESLKESLNDYHEQLKELRGIRARNAKLEKVMEAANNLMSCGPLCDTLYWNELRAAIDAAKE